MAVALGAFVIWGQYSVWGGGKQGLRRRQCVLQGAGSQPRQLRLMELGYHIYRGLRTPRACLCPCSCAGTCRSFLIALVERQEMESDCGEPVPYQLT